jgi:hypothetical protein
MKLASLITIAAVSLLSGGCMGVGYVPALSNKPYSGKPLAGRDADFIAAGKTTRAEVVKKLGTGYRDSVRVWAIAYPWELPGGRWFFFAVGQMGGGISGGPENTRWRALFLDFDGRGIVTRKEFVRLKQKLTLDEQLEAWAGWVPRNTPPVLLP